MEPIDELHQYPIGMIGSLIARGYPYAGERMFEVIRQTNPWNDAITIDEVLDAPDAIMKELYANS